MSRKHSGRSWRSPSGSSRRGSFRLEAILMQWFEESDDLTKVARFRDVSGRKRPDLSWARAGTPDAASLRPPRLPTVCGADDEPPPDATKEVSGLHALPASLELPGMMSAYDHP